MSQIPHLAPGARVQADRITGQSVLLFPEGMLRLNPTGAAIVELCDGKRSIRLLLEELSRQFNAPANVLRADVVEYVSRLAQRGLVRLESKAPAESAGGASET